MDKIFSLKNLFVLIVILVMFLFLKDDGLIDYQALLNQRNQLESKITKLENELDLLKQEIWLLETSNQYIQKIAREKYQYIFPNETIIQF